MEFYDIAPDNIISHAEGYQKGVASNHADVGHWFPKHGKTMDDLRRDVKDKLSKQTAPESTTLTQEQFNVMLKIGLKQMLGI
jgi:N-acetylmuramoyl-L-alanine amidase